MVSNLINETNLQAPARLNIGTTTGTRAFYPHIQRKPDNTYRIYFTRWDSNSRDGLWYADSPATELPASVGAQVFMNIGNKLNEEASGHEIIRLANNKYRMYHSYTPSNDEHTWSLHYRDTTDTNLPSESNLDVDVALGIGGALNNACGYPKVRLLTSGYYRLYYMKEWKYPPALYKICYRDTTDMNPPTVGNLGAEVELMTAQNFDIVKYNGVCRLYFSSDSMTKRNLRYLDTVDGEWPSASDVNVNLFKDTLSGNTNYTNYSIRQRISASRLANNASSFSITLTSSTAADSNFLRVYIGHRAIGGNGWNFDGTQVEVKFNGVSGVNISYPNVLAVSDPIAYALDKTRDIILAFDMSTTTGNVRYAGGKSGADQFSKLTNGANEASLTAPSGYDFNAGYLFCVTHIGVSTALGIGGAPSDLPQYGAIIKDGSDNWALYYTTNKTIDPIYDIWRILAMQLPITLLPDMRSFGRRIFTGRAA